MEERQAYILQQLVVEHIRTARPVGSVQLGQRLAADLSSATIRIVFRDLEEAGYIEQPHTSAGRVPTDKGYRYYVNQLRPRVLPERERSAMTRQLERNTEQGLSAARATSRVLARLAHTMAISGLLTRQEIEEAGFDELLEHAEGVEVMRENSPLIEEGEQYVDQLARSSSEEPVVFIGAENPFFTTPHSSLIARAVRLPNGERAVLILLGPKRMPYSRHLAVVESMARIMADRLL
jgi:transcriptional regulator of heat shock response